MSGIVDRVGEQVKGAERGCITHEAIDMQAVYDLKRALDVHDLVHKDAEKKAPRFTSFFDKMATYVSGIPSEYRMTPNDHAAARSTPPEINSETAQANPYTPVINLLSPERRRQIEDQYSRKH
ncbi:MAG: hypothetical protein HY832_01990 [Candidatus Aenigmarchaeota archaeon]|nr:hypothetical protein [Candidatus Aenigmarchaeota archaeon]